jgi:hypothetical protein
MSGKPLRYSMYNDYFFSYLVSKLWNLSKDDIILKGLSNENNPRKEFPDN